MSIDVDEVVEIWIDVGLPRVLRTAFPTPPSWAPVKYCNQTRTWCSRITASIIPYLTGQFVMAVPQYLQCSSSHAKISHDL